MNRKWRVLGAYTRAAWQKARFEPSAIARVAKGEALAAYWSRTNETVNNFGDRVSPLLMESLTGKSVVHVCDVQPILRLPTLYLVGSILDNLRNRRAVVAGSGFKHRDAVVRTAPLHVVGVRGPLSRDRLMSSGVDCPPVYCDPALVLPRFLSAPLDRTQRTGIVAHYVDKTIVEGWHLDATKYKLIDIEQDPEFFVKELASCSKIISSSLHGIIAAHAYGIPAAWAIISGRTAGGEFKYQDYFRGMGIDDAQPLSIVDRSELARASFNLPACVEQRVEAFLDAFSAVLPYFAPGSS